MKIENHLTFIEDLYSPSILSLFQEEKKSKKPFILLNIEGIDFILINKELFFQTIDKYKEKVKKVEFLKRGWIILYLEKKMIKYEIIPTMLNLKVV